MKIEVIKPKEEKWSFPCKGVHKQNGLVIGFTEEGVGCVLEKGQTNYELYSYEEFWDMDTFTPIKEKGNNYDWSNPKFQNRQIRRKRSRRIFGQLEYGLF